jgi:hypothetical protein
VMFKCRVGIRLQISHAGDSHGASPTLWLAPNMAVGTTTTFLLTKHSSPFSS